MSLFQIVILAVFGALAIAGVGIFAFFVGSTQTQSIGEVTIWGTLDTNAFVVVLRQLAEEDGRLRSVTYIRKEPETFSNELTNALASGAGPDLFIMRQSDAERDAAKVLPIPYESFPREQFKDLFIEAANPFLGEDGVRAIPLAVDPLVLYWNRDLMASSGLAKPPGFWDELYGMATAITKRDQANTIEKSALAFGEYDNVDHAKDIIALLILQAGGSITARDSTGNLTTALSSRTTETQQPVESALRFYTEFANPSKTFYTWNRAQKESLAAFGAGTLAMYVGPASEEPLIRRLNPNLNFAIAPIPQIRTRPYTLDVGTVYAFAMPRTGVNPQGALTVAYLLSSAKASKLLSQALGIPSARRDVLAEVATGNDDLFNKQAIITQAWLDPDPDKTDVIFRDMIQGITSGAVKLSDGIQRADRAMGELMKRE